MKIIGTRTSNGMDFKHYTVIKKSENYFAVMRDGSEITSAESMWAACKKAKLLEIGYEHARQIYSEWF